MHHQHELAEVRRRKSLPRRPTASRVVPARASSGGSKVFIVTMPGRERGLDARAGARAREAAGGYLDLG